MHRGDDDLRALPKWVRCYEAWSELYRSLVCFRDLEGKPVSVGGALDEMFAREFGCVLH